MSRTRLARWYADPRACAVPALFHPWLCDQGSLTLKLRARCRQFRVRRLHQCLAPCLFDEAGEIGLRRPQQGWEREVLLYCDDMPVVFAHTVVPMTANANDWPLFSALGERSLGTTLFGDPLVSKGALEYAKLSPRHPLYQRALRALARAGVGRELPAQLFARRCLYRRKRGLLLVTEVFFPWIVALPAPGTLPSQV